jgi:Na+-transporting NADH:ubiquinone oxidoreductase subunit F
MNTHADSYMLTLVRKVHEYGNVYTFIFSSKESIVFTAGQFAHMRLKGLSAGEEVREFSLASAPQDRELWFTTHIRPESPFKQKLSSVQPGEEVEIFKIRGDFVLPDTPEDIVFIAGGIGITPIHAMYRSIVEQKIQSTPLLIHVAEGTYLYESELKELPFEQFRVTRDTFNEALTQVISKHPQQYTMCPVHRDSCNMLEKNFVSVVLTRNTLAMMNLMDMATYFSHEKESIFCATRREYT